VCLIRWVRCRARHRRVLIVSEAPIAGSASKTRIAAGRPIPGESVFYSHYLGLQTWGRERNRGGRHSATSK